MCEIAGFVTCPPLGEARACSLTHAMAERLVHRGPDAEGVWSDSDGRVALGHRRLSIIDLRVAGRQPTPSASGRWCIIFSGEMFNYQDLRVALEHVSRGAAKWRGHSDTEVIAAAVEQGGVIRTVRELAGQSTIGFGDDMGQELYLARDRFGEKPLCYGFVGSSFAFASSTGICISMRLAARRRTCSIAMCRRPGASASASGRFLQYPCYP